MLHVSWSINDSAVLGLAPLDGYIDMVPPTARYPGHVKIWYEGYPSTGLYYKKTARSFSWGTVDQEPEGPAFNLGSIVGDYTNKYEWPR